MHFEFLVEDRSGKVALEGILPKITPANASFTIHHYKGIGHIPKGLRPNLDPSKRILLDQLPKLLSGYGRTFASYPNDYPAAVIVVCDLDRRDLKTFLGELDVVLSKCNPRPDTRFCLSIEEGEAWLLGDKEAVLGAYPHANKKVLDEYVYDSICGTWEVLADAIYPGGASALLASGKPEVGRLKSVWAETIPPFIEVARNRSPSFKFFVNTIHNFLNKP